MNPAALRRVAGFVFCVLLSCVFPLSAGTSDLLQPIALWPATSGGLYVLDRVAGLLYIPGTGGLDLHRSSKVAAFSGSWQTVDMAAIGSGSDDRVYVLLGQETLGMLLCYSNRRFERSWMAKTLLNGIAPDPEGYRLFLTGALTNEIYVFDLNNSAASPTQLFVAVHGSEVLGPLTLDSGRHVLYVADQRSGVIFAVNIESKSVSRLTQIGGQINALAFDSTHSTLYVADSVGGKVWSIRVDPKIAKPRIYSASPDFRRPVALAVDRGGTVWVGDLGAQAIFRLSPSGAATAYHLILRPDYGPRP